MEALGLGVIHQSSIYSSVHIKFGHMRERKVGLHYLEVHERLAGMCINYNGLNESTSSWNCISETQGIG